MKQYTECERQLAKILLASQIQTLDSLFFFFFFFDIECYRVLDNHS